MPGRRFHGRDSATASVDVPRRAQPLRRQSVEMLCAMNSSTSTRTTTKTIPTIQSTFGTRHLLACRLVTARRRQDHVVGSEHEESEQRPRARLCRSRSQSSAPWCAVCTYQRCTRTRAGFSRGLSGRRTLPHDRASVRATVHAAPRSSFASRAAPAPRIDMHRCSASMTTPTPRGASSSSRRFAICTVIRSCT